MLWTTTIPVFDIIPIPIQRLLKRCWTDKPEDRPAMNEIVGIMLLLHNSMSEHLDDPVGIKFYACCGWMRNIKYLFCWHWNTKMRRTRYVVLPVRSWHYVGLMVVSLACLTLGLVSRDREGKSGSLTGPELKHTAPHEVDACPNEFPYADQIRTADDDLATRRINPEKRILERRARESPKIRVTLENKRLNRMHISRSITLQDMRTRNDERRTASLDRRHSDISRLRDTRNVRRLNDDRLSPEINARRYRIQERASKTSRQDGINRERIAREDILLRSRGERRLSMSERRDRTEALDRQDRRARIDMTRRNIIQVEERRSLDRRERIHHAMRDNRRINNNRHLERHERASTERRDGRVTVETSEPTRINVVDVDSSRRNIRIRMNPAIELNRRQLSRERQVSITDGRLSRLNDERSGTRRYNSRYTDGYFIPETQFPFVKSSFGNGSYEFLRQTFILALCTFYTASLFKRKGRNILPGINQLQVW
ncbi:hypothetical protein PV328_004470 [Microctonus aethiopoides]|uniref:Uncharacterized protein n=1 Tax=Microctonus aethiopoides TaxID=144406 RepID=A0AA39FAJ9_9HYME|nr:hypothetical protein PV328_004470 [Microctonus aethiopoides]